MLKREILQKLQDWKQNKNKKCLIVQGARQIGKTYIIEYFGKNSYENFIELNFVENPSFCKIFEGDLDINTILANFSLYTPFASKLVPNKTLIFLDEIQACPNARTALKFFAIDKRFDVIASGSLLGISYEKVASYPTGYVEFLDMYPLTFIEFLWANNVSDDVISIIYNCFKNHEKVNDAMNLKLLEYFKQYIVIGGMPEVVNDFVNNHNYENVLKIQRNILIDYQNDIAKYAESTEKVKARACFLSIPAQLSKENKKFLYSVVEKNSKSKKYLGSINWLVDAGIVNMCVNLTTLSLPLVVYAQNDYFKLYMADTGLLVAMLDDGTNAQIIDGDIGIFKGAIFENVVAQILIANHNKLYFYTKNNSLELDFVVSKNGKIIPIEVKANNNKAKSLALTLKQNPNMTGIKLVYGNVGEKDNLLTLPIYMVMFL